jgi:hypothetical protein
MLLTYDVAASIPPPHEAAKCSVASESGERPNARFARKGGRTARAKVVFQDDELTVKDVAQGRDLAKYERLTLTRPSKVFLMTRRGMTGEQAEREARQVLARARTFLFEHWRDHKQAYITLTGSSVDATSTSHIFVEQDSSGRWRVAWRIVLDMGEVDDLPTYYTVEWVKPAAYGEHGTPLLVGESPDPIRNMLEFRDKCGDIEHSL